MFELDTMHVIRSETMGGFRYVIKSINLNGNRTPIGT